MEGSTTPSKAALIEMQENGDFNLEAEHVKYCVSWYTMHVSQVGTTMFVTAWNEHRISGIFHHACPL